MTRVLSLRQRNKLAAQRAVQEAALVLFEARGFDAVTVEDVASAAGVSAMTVYRYFGTKEGIVLWDEHGEDVGRLIAERLPVVRPAQAVLDAMVGAHAKREDVALLYRRLHLIYTTESLWGAAARIDPEHRRELARGFALVAGEPDVRIVDEVLAAGCLAAVDVALARWVAQVEPAGEALEAVLREAFAGLHDVFAR